MVQPLEGGQSYVTFYSGGGVLLAPDATAHGGGTGTVYVLSEMPRPQAWSEPFISPPQGAPADQWAEANGYAFEGTAPSSEALSLNVTNGSLAWTNKGIARAKGTYNFTLWKAFDQPLYYYNISISIFASKGAWNIYSPPLYLTITAHDQKMTPIVTLRFNTSGTSLYGNASAYGGATVALLGINNASHTFTLFSGGYGEQATLEQGQSQKLSFTCFTPLKCLSINYFINETAYGDYDASYIVKVEDVIMTPGAPAAALFGVPAGEWWYTASNGETVAWQVTNGAGVLDLANLPTAFNGEFSSATTGAWVPQGLSSFSVSSGCLNTKGSGGEMTNNGLGQPASSFPGALYALPVYGEGDFYVAVRVALSGWTTSPQYTSRIGLALTDTSGNIIAYLTAKFNSPRMSSAINLEDCYYGVQPNNANGGSLLRYGRSSLTLNISRVGSEWNIYCAETETNFTATGTNAQVGGILLHHANTINGMNAGWDYVRTNLPADIGVLSGSPDQQAVRIGKFYANTTLTYTETDSGMPLLVSSTTQDSGGLKFAGVSEGDLVTLFGSDGSAVFNATVTGGTSGITVAGVELPFTGTASVICRPISRPIAQYSGNISGGDTLSLTCDDQGAYSISKVSTGGDWSGVLVTGLQQGWKVTVTGGGSDAVLYAGHSGRVFVPLPTETVSLSVFKPTAAVRYTLQQGNAYFLERMLGFPELATSDTIFYEISTTGYRYRVEAQILSVDRQDGWALGSLDKITFRFGIYEGGGLMHEVTPTVMIGESGTSIPVTKTGAYTFAALIPTGSEPLLVKLKDPMSGIIVEGRLIFGH
ncbi:MAG: hypothetical protein ABC537_02130 [Candidatus Methanosuratincola sp.]